MSYSDDRPRVGPDEDEDNRPLTICVKCRHCVKQTAGCIWEWACKRMPTKPEYNYVTGKRTNYEFCWCSQVNKNGHCSMYKEKE